MTRPLMLAAVFMPCIVAATSASAQNNGLPSRQQSAVLVEVFAQRGESCGLLRPWEAASLRVQTRDDIARLSDTARLAVAQAIDARIASTKCDDSLLNTWIAGSKPGFEREHLPELLTAYHALSSLDPPPAPFIRASKRTDFAAARATIDAKIAALESAGVAPARGMTWKALAERQTNFARQFADAIAGVGDTGRFSAAQATQLTEDVARIVELWLVDQAANINGRE